MTNTQRLPAPLPWWPYCLAHLKPGQHKIDWPCQEHITIPRLQGITCPSHMWQPPIGFWDGTDACPTAACLYHILERLALTLEATACSREDINPFLYPLANTPGGCMVYDPSTRRRWPAGIMMDVNREKGEEDLRYLRVVLGRDSEGVVRREGAHRMVLLATAGPPGGGAGTSDSVAHDRCIHIGCDNKACLNPLHLAWGSATENNYRVHEYDTDPARLEEDRRRVKGEKERVAQRKRRDVEARGLGVRWEYEWITSGFQAHKDYHSRIQ